VHYNAMPKSVAGHNHVCIADYFCTQSLLRPYAH